MESIHRLCNCDNVSAYVETCCFNPTIYFVCKLCRGAFENVEKLLLHKRQEHTVNELKGIKFLIFEERFVETDDNCFPNALTSTATELKSEILGDTTITTNANPSPRVNKVDSPEINNVINISDELEDSKLPNPFVHLRRLKSKEINGYSRSAAATIQIQKGEGPQISQHHLLSANVCDVTFNTEPKTEFEAQEIAEGEFIVANVVQSSDGTGNVQFLSTDTCIPVTVLTPQNIQITPNPNEDFKEPINNTLDDENGMEVNSFKNATESEEFNNFDCDASISEVISADDAPPSAVMVPVPSPTQDPVPGPELCYGKEVDLPVQTKTISIRVLTPTEPLPQLQISAPPSTTGRKLRTRQKINYFESQTCTNCSKECHTVQEFETHEKVCFQNKSKREQFSKGDLLLITIPNMAGKTPGGNMNYTEEIQTTEIYTNDLDLELVTNTDRAGDQDQDDYPEISSSDSDECDKKVGADDRTTGNNDATEDVVVSQVNVDSIDEPENKGNTCFTSFKDWCKKQREANRLLKKTPDISLKCTICGKELATKQSFKSHMEIHENPNLKNFICETCGIGFRVSSHLQRHKLSHSEDRPFKCKLCPLAFKKQDILRKHRVVHVKDTNYHCLPCNKSFKSKNLLQRHFVQHLQDKWHPCKAEDCDLKFPSYMSVWTHCKKDHAELFSQLAKLSCTVCNEKFMFNSQLRRHMFSHGGEREKRFKCSQEGCDSSFTAKPSLEEHFRKHTGERPYQCDKCGTTFARQCLFLIHLKAHNSPKDRVLCHLCPRTFSRNWELQQHLTFHEKGRQFKCDKCELKFMSKSNLKGHMKTHEAEGDVEDDSSSSSISSCESENNDSDEATEDSGSESEIPTK